MRPFIKFTIWLATAFVGLFVWNAAPDFRPILTWLLPVAIVGHAAVFSVQTTIRRLVSRRIDRAASAIGSLYRSTDDAQSQGNGSVGGRVGAAAAAVIEPLERNRPCGHRTRALCYFVRVPKGDFAIIFASLWLMASMVMGQGFAT